MRLREEQAAVVSVDHPDVVEDYRQAHEISLESDRGEASTEDLRQAMKRYRSLFDELLDDGRDGDRGRSGAEVAATAPERDR